jgi:hypothetical protein
MSNIQTQYSNWNPNIAMWLMAYFVSQAGYSIYYYSTLAHNA